MKKHVFTIALLLLVLLACILRLYRMPDRPFLVNEIWMWTVGINLHSTGFFNLQDHLTNNFFKSLLYLPYGWADSLPYYLASGIYDFLKIPLNEFWLYFMHVIITAGNVALLYQLGKTLFNPAAGLVSALLLSILPIDITVFGSGLVYHSAFLMFLQLFLILSLVRYSDTGRWYYAALFSLAIFLNAGTENVIILPVVIVFQYLLEYEKECRFGLAAKDFLKKIFSFRYILLWIPSIFVVCAQLYIYYRVGESNLGMIAYVSWKYLHSVSRAALLFRFQQQLTMLFENFFTFYVVLLGIFLPLYLISQRSKIKIRFLGVAVWFLIPFFISAYTGQGLDGILAFRYSHYFIPLMLIAGYLTVWIFKYIANMRITHVIRRVLVIMMAITLGLLFTYHFSALIKDVTQRKVYSNPLKAASFYVRERGGKESTVFQLIRSDSSRNFWGEYYFGRCYMEPGDETGVRRQLFCSGQNSVDEYKKAYGLKDFDFYIDYNDEETIENAESITEGLKKVADIKRDGKTIATIYSPHDLVYEALDAPSADRGWDSKYANIKNLLQNRWCGLANLWGYHHRIK